MICDQSKDRIEGAYAQGVMLWDGQPLMRGNICLQNDVAADSPPLPVLRALWPVTSHKSQVTVSCP
ncbi:MAG: hypothetical protein ACKOEG_11420, partial [Chthoniobacterales bacterium]